MPASLSVVRKPRLFARKSEQTSLWVEQLWWMKATPDPFAAVNDALSKLRPYSEDSLSNSREPYGTKEQQILDMYKNYVPRQFVPEMYDIPAAQSTLLRQAMRQAKLTADQGLAQVTAASSGAAPTSTAIQKENWRYNRSRDDTKVIKVVEQMYNGRGSSLKAKDYNTISSMMDVPEGFEIAVTGIKTAVKRLVSERKLM